jgi:CheY-like chemotaxis protein
MNDVPKVLVVDDGERSPDRALSVELAELGFASVTTSFEAAEDVLAVLPTPSAVLLQLPGTPDTARRQSFRDLADRLKAKPALAGIPVVVVEARQGLSALPAYERLNESFGAHALAKPRQV